MTSGRRRKRSSPRSPTSGKSPIACLGPQSNILLTSCSAISPSRMRSICWLMNDVGAGLDLDLYEDACIHFCGGRLQVLGETQIIIDGRTIGSQPVRFVEPGLAFKITAI